MHLLFLGVTKYILKQILLIINKAKDHINIIGKLTQNLRFISNLKISWLHCAPLKKNGSTSWWVSKNYACVGRICNWWLSILQNTSLDNVLSTSENMYTNISGKINYNRSVLFKNTFIVLNKMIGQVFNDYNNKVSSKELDQSIKMFLNIYNVFDIIFFDKKIN